jgi:hypothetical protein
MTREPPGWYPDPSNPYQDRYWDGREWSDSLVRSPAGPKSTTRWEYDHIEEVSGGMDHVVDAMNTMGANGWEAFSVLSGGSVTNSVIVLFKRPAPDG